VQLTKKDKKSTVLHSNAVQIKSGGISRRMRLGACDFGYVTRVQWLQHIDGSMCGRRGLCWLCRRLWIGSPCGGHVSLGVQRWFSNSETPSKQVFI